MTTIRGERKKPTIQKHEKTALESKEVLLPIEKDDIHITGIIVDEVTMPKNDGTRGSALYSIPFRLSDKPSQRWIKLFLNHWNYPSRFTTMHRPGIASVIGEKIILNGTTIEEVQKYHRDTLVLSVDQANKEEKRMLEEEQKQRICKQREEEEHRRKISDISSQIDF